VIIGGVAGGASCAARLRRLDESLRITILERGPFVSFANCGLPYRVGGVIEVEGALLLASPELFRSRYNIEVRVMHEVTQLDLAGKQVVIHDLVQDRIYRQPYDVLVLATGASPIRPNWPGIHLPGIFVTRTIEDTREIRSWIDTRRPRRAVVVGASFVGLEMAENLVRRGIGVTVVEALPQVMPALDPEMTEPVMRHLETNRVNLHLGDGVAGFEETAGEELAVHTQSGKKLDAGLVILGIGVRPETALARAAGLEVGGLGGIRVDETLRTSDPHIWAVGDAVEVRHAVTEQWCLMPLAGPANRMGRIAADAICGRRPRFRGVQGTGVCGIFGLTVAFTGATEKALKRDGVQDYASIYLHPHNHAAYYPMAAQLHIKLLFSRPEGRILGAQVVGGEGAEKRIDVISMAIQKGGTVFDLEEAELSYAPQYGSARDAANLCGMAAANMLRGDMPLAAWEKLEDTEALILDVREPFEFAMGHIEGAANIPLGDLRGRLSELPRDREIWVNCGTGLRSYFAVRVLLQNGFSACNLSGGYLTYWGFHQ
jgi:NADPH-dependent 2,4-dienoyl-CoA reductase/sulfur reductase-like enzyme/rhodanese-related sulfurtransferase